MQQKRVTLEKIAHAAGVSRATVSLVVRKSPLVAEHTRARIEQIMAEMDYVRDIGAARLRNKSSRTVGLIVPNLVNSFFTEFLSRVEEVMAQDDRVVLLANSQDDPWRKDLVRLAQLVVLAFQRLQLLGHLGRDARALAAADLGLPDPFVHGMGRTADLRRNRHDRLPARPMLTFVVEDHPRRALAP